MKLWLISQDVNRGYDTYDSAVVAANSEEQAKLIHPDGGDENITMRKDCGYGCWAFNPADVKCRLVGSAVKGTTAGVICASFNAG